MSASSDLARATSLVDASKLNELMEYMEDLTEDEKVAAIFLADQAILKDPSDEGVFTAREALMGKEMFDKPEGLPPLRDDNDVFDAVAGMSVWVLLKLKQVDEVIVGHYFHTIDKWKLANNATSTFENDEVEEWWPMPAIGTGTAPELKQEGE